LSAYGAALDCLKVICWTVRLARFASWFFEGVLMNNEARTAFVLVDLDSNYFCGFLESEQQGPELASKYHGALASAAMFPTFNEAASTAKILEAGHDQFLQVREVGLGRPIVRIQREEIESRKEDKKALIQPQLTDEIIQLMGKATLDVMLGNPTFR
jgi:hypothetical protein